jgi:hypothetical protein
MNVEAAGSSETSPLYNTLYEIVFQQTVTAVTCRVLSGIKNADTA